jgi:PAS domain S-box-containing protein
VPVIGKEDHTQDAVVSASSLRLTVLPVRLAVCRLPAGSPLPPWASRGEFLSITRTADELSVICAEASVPEGVLVERGYQLFRVEGPIPFEVVGVLAQLTSALAAAGISILAVTTYDTDYLLVRSGAVANAIAVLESAGCTVTNHAGPLSQPAPPRLQMSRASDPVSWAPLALRRLADSDLVGVMLVSLNGTVLDANAAVLEILGRTRATVDSGQLDWRTITAAEHAAIDEQVLEALRTRGAAPPFEQEFVRPDGSRVPVLLMMAMCGVARDADLAVCFVVDQTARYEANRALRASERRFRMLADAAPIFIWMAGPDKRCTFVNRRWLEFRGRTFDEEAGWGWSEGIHADDAARARRTFDDAFDARQSFRMEYRLLRHDGAYRWLLDYGVPINDEDGTFVGFLGSCVDITPRRLAEQQREDLLARERAARAQAVRLSRVKDEFLGTLSHELRTPLNAILGWTQVLRRGGRPEHLAPALEVIDRNARTLTQLVDDLLDVSEIVTGRLRLQTERIHIDGILDDVLRAVKPAADARGLRLVCDVQPGTPPVMGDPARLRQVAWNLVSNAVKFTPHGGDISIRIARADGHVGFSVEDTGEGIPSEFLPHVFDRFTQADPSASRHHGGLGLGLAIVRHLVELHGGQVSAFSAGVDQGARFTVLLPVTEDHAPSDA